jgi:putative glutamine amidotransferase
VIDSVEGLEGCAGLMLTGGTDYGVNSKRDGFEKLIFEKAYGKIPILGICRGMQVINIFLGGTVKDIDETNPIHMPIGEESSYHDVTIKGIGTMEVNSRHHQTIAELSPKLEVFATAEDGIIEGVKGNRLIAVQWHPERKEDSSGNYVISKFHRLF